MIILLYYQEQWNCINEIKSRYIYKSNRKWEYSQPYNILEDEREIMTSLYNGRKKRVSEKYLYNGKEKKMCIGWQMK